MAVIKAVSAKSSIGAAIKYVTQKEKTDVKLMSGIGCSPETAKQEMEATKELWGKTGGRTYKSFVQSFHTDERMDPEQAHRIACALASGVKAWKGHEVLIVTHKDRGHIHTHFIVNTVNAEDGHKLQWSKKDLADMKALSDQLCRENGLTICEKGKTFHGEERENTTAYNKDTYQLLKKAEKEEAPSYVQEIALAVMDARETATNREDFKKKLADKGIDVTWSDTRAHITFVDVARELAGEKKCKVRGKKMESYYNIDFSKEGLEHEFAVNARGQKEREGTGGTGRPDSGSGERKLDAVIQSGRDVRDHTIHVVGDAIAKSSATDAEIDHREAARRDASDEQQREGEAAESRKRVASDRTDR